MAFGDIWALRKDDGGGGAGGDASAAPASGPTQSDVHVDKIIGAIHPFSPGVGARCKVCGKTSHAKAFSFAKAISQHGDRYAGNPTAGSGPDGPSPESDDGQSASPDPWPKPPSPMLRPVTDLEDEDQHAQSPGFLPVAPAANSSAPIFGQNVTRTSDAPNTDDMASVPFHLPVPGLPALDSGVSKALDGSDVGEHVTPKPQGVYHSPTVGHVGQSEQHHDLTQCPRCGVGVTGTELECPGCGHDLPSDATTSYDSWDVPGLS